MTGADLTATIKKHPLGVICGLLALGCGIFLYSRSDSISVSQAELDARTAEANKMIANVRNSTALATQVTEIQEQRKEFESRLLRAGQLAVNLQYFYKLEAETEVKLSGDVRQNNGAKGSKAYVGVPFAVSIQGSYPQVMNFINRLQNGRHFCRITGASYSKIGGGSETSSVTTDHDIALSLNLELLAQP